MTDAEKDIRETAQIVNAERLNFGLVQVVYEWARNKVGDFNQNQKLILKANKLNILIKHSFFYVYSRLRK